MTGLWANVDPMEVAHIDVWRRNPARFWSFYGQRFALLDGKEPNGAHRALAELERRGLLTRVITQNIDGLHAKARDRDPIEVHGSIRTASCLRRRLVLFAGGDPGADGRSRRRPALRLRRAVEARRRPVRRVAAGGRDRAGGEFAASARLMLAIGSSLEVYPVAGLPADTLAAGGRLALVTMGPTPYDRHAVVKLSGDVVDELEAVLAALG